jgi:hypothetical protein
VVVVVVAPILLLLLLLPLALLLTRMKLHHRAGRAYDHRRWTFLPPWTMMKAPVQLRAPHLKTQTEVVESRRHE